MIGEKSPLHSKRVNERFYEKVIKVKADVAALLNLFPDVSIVEWFSLFLELARWHPHSASPFWHSASSSFRFGHRTFWICFEPSPLGNSGRRHPTVGMLLSAL